MSFGIIKRKQRRTNKMEKQKIFDTVATHLAVQGFRAWNKLLEQCVFRAPDGSKCAFGIFIPDDIYKRSMEDYGVETLIDEAPELRHEFKDHIEFLVTLQKIHDNHNNWTSVNMPAKLIWCGNRFEVDTSIIDRLDFGLIIPNRLD